MATEPSRPLVALLPSALLGPAVWEPVAAALRRRGHDVVVPPAHEAVTGPDDVLDHLRRAIPAGRPVVLVPHSNAGPYVAQLAAERPVVAIVFVDAGLPSDESSTPTAPPEFRGFLDGHVEADGRLPVWTRWWAEDEVADLFPDGDTRTRVEAQQPRLPLRYFDVAIPSPPGWEALPAAYVAFGETYGRERAEAERRGWPVRTLDGGHLHMLIDAEGVAETLAGLLDRLDS
ncbi:hypothetical protein ACVW00_000447 [Marmoricola sp. URHA0025 HA25]